MTEAEWNDTAAAEIAVILTAVNNPADRTIAIFDMDGRVAQELDKHLARALAIRLVKLAETLPAPRVVLDGGLV